MNNFSKINMSSNNKYGNIKLETVQTNQNLSGS